MHKKKSYYFVFLGILFLVYLIVEIFKPKEIDWSLDFSCTKKIPYGCFVFKDLLPVAKPDLVLIINHQNLYDALDNKAQRNSNLLIITETFNPEKIEISSLLNYIKNGNKALISAINFNKLFTDTLNINTKFDISSIKNIQQPIKINLVNPHLRFLKDCVFSNMNPVYFSSFDTTNTTLLGHDSNNKAIFISINIGKGSLLLMTKPEIFTNFHILYSSSDFAFKSISYLDSRNLIWDEYYKPKSIISENQSPLRYILSQVSLKYAYFLLLLTLILFAVFESKRRQRIIPVYSAPVNASKEFVETIGRLYLYEGDHIDLAKKKIQYFYETISSTYYLKVEEASQQFRKQFAEKAMIPLKKSEAIFDEIIRIKNKETLSEKDLIKFIKMIEQVQKTNVKMWKFGNV